MFTGLQRYPFSRRVLRQEYVAKSAPLPSETTVLCANCEHFELASSAGKGEVLISEAAYRAARIENEGLEKRELELKGKSEKISVRVMLAS